MNEAVCIAADEVPMKQLLNVESSLFQKKIKQSEIYFETMYIFSELI